MFHGSMWASVTLSFVQSYTLIVSRPAALSLLPDNPCSALLLLRRLLRLDPSALIPYMDVLVQALTKLLEPGVPRRVQTLCCELWTKVNTVIPRK